MNNNKSEEESKIDLSSIALGNPDEEVELDTSFGDLNLTRKIGKSVLRPKAEQLADIREEK